jgi:hypothetical protein
MRRQREENNEEARARHYAKVAAWFTFAQQPRYVKPFGHMSSV